MAAKAPVTMFSSGTKAHSGGKGEARGQGSRKGLSYLFFPRSLFPADIFLHINGQNWVLWPLLSIKVVGKASMYLAF